MKKEKVIRVIYELGRLLEVLKRGRWYLVEYGWCQGYLAIDEDKRETEVRTRKRLFDCGIPHKPPVAFCAQGACLRASLDLGMFDLGYFQDSLSALRRTLSSPCHPDISVAAFNDFPGQTKEGVIGMFDDAIALVEKEIERVGGLISTGELPTSTFRAAPEEKAREEVFT